MTATAVSETRRMQELVAELWRLEGPSVETHVGDLAWQRFQHSGREHEWRIRVWEDGGEPVAFAWVRLPSTLQYEIHPSQRDLELHDEVVAWFEATAEGDELRTSSLSTDHARLAVLARHGYGPSGERDMAYHVRDLSDLPDPVVAEGYRLRTVGPKDLERRVAAHRAAFAPSRVTSESYAAVQAAWPYDPRLDCVVQAPDGTFASFCLAWLDGANRVGELEPVGTHPDHRRTGLARTVCLFALGRLRQHGAAHAVVYAWAPSAGKEVYESIGFREHTRSIELVKHR